MKQYKVKEDIPELYFKEGDILTREEDIDPEMDGMFYWYITFAGKGQPIMAFFVEKTPELFEPYLPDDNSIHNTRPALKIVFGNSIVAGEIRKKIGKAESKGRFSSFTDFA